MATAAPGPWRRAQRTPAKLRWPDLELHVLHFRRHASLLPSLSLSQPNCCLDAPVPATRKGPPLSLLYLTPVMALSRASVFRTVVASGARAGSRVSSHWRQFGRRTYTSDAAGHGPTPKKSDLPWSVISLSQPNFFSGFMNFNLLDTRKS